MAGMGGKRTFDSVVATHGRSLKLERNVDAKCQFFDVSWEELDADAAMRASSSKS
jgi:hypothetical protein